MIFSCKIANLLFAFSLSTTNVHVAKQFQKNKAQIVSL